jgi:hypothetical protein
LEESDIEKNYFDYKDHWLTAEEAKEAGLYANVEDTEAENIPDNVSGMKFSDLVKLFEPSDSLFPDWVNRIAPTKPDNSNFIDMDIKLLRDAYGLDEEKYPKPEDVLNYVKKREQEYKDLDSAKTTAENDLATATQTITDKDAEIAELKEKPGADPANVDTDTDPKGGDPKEPKPAEDFFGAMADCMKVLNPEK